MRGKVSFRLFYRSVLRITPAYAGKSAGHFQLPAGAEDHPRLCGEKFLVQLLHRRFRGSPPPMRGKGTVCQIGYLRYGITPAYAGKSMSSWRRTAVF